MVGPDHLRVHTEWAQNGITHRVEKHIPRPQLAADYHRNAIAIDYHNRLRQDGLAYEKCDCAGYSTLLEVRLYYGFFRLGTRSWAKRYGLSLLGICQTNAFELFREDWLTEHGNHGIICIDCGYIGEQGGMMVTLSR